MPNPTQPPAEVYRQLKAFERAAAQADAEVVARLAKRWAQVERDLRTVMRALADELAAQQAAGKALTPGQVLRLERYRDLARQAQAEVARYEQYAAHEIAAAQAERLALGIDAASATMRGLGLAFNRLPVGAVNAMIGMCADGAPLFDLLAKRALGPEALAGLTDALLRGVAQGIGPRTTARMMADGLAQGLQKALTIARTEQIRAYREAARAQYAAGGVERYQRNCAYSDRTCILCIALDGKEYPTDQPPDSHPNCRCFMTPIIPGMTPLGGEGAQDWFAGRSQAEQIEAFGSRAKYDAWRGGTPLEAFVQIDHDPTWGPTMRATPLSILQGEMP